VSSMRTADREIIDRVREVLARALEVPLESVPTDAAQGSFERWDSLGHLNVVMELEAAFGVSFSTNEAVGMRSVAEIVEVLKRQMNGH
jgi:acyl carrier protein